MTLWYVEVLKRNRGRDRLRRVVRYVVLEASEEAAKDRVLVDVYKGLDSEIEQMTCRPWEQSGSDRIVRLGTEIRQY